MKENRYRKSLADPNNEPKQTTKAEATPKADDELLSALAAYFENRLGVKRDSK